MSELRLRDILLLVRKCLSYLIMQHDQCPVIVCVSELEQYTSRFEKQCTSSLTINIDIDSVIKS